MLSEQDSWEKQLEEKRKFLSEPFMEMFDENTFRIRRNLLIISSVVLAYKYSATGISPESSFLGVKLEGVDSESIDTILFIGVFYFLLHFVWSSLDKFSEWRLRLSGMPVPKARNIMSAGANYEAGTNNQRQSSLSGWWAANVKYYIEKDMYAENKSDFDNAHAYGIQSTVELIKNRLNELSKKGVHIEAYLERYEKGFNNLQCSQRWRWLIVEFSLPIAMALVSLYVLLLMK